jgi:hypothetical protein
MKIKIAIVAVLLLAFAAFIYLWQTGKLGIVNPENKKVEGQAIDDSTFVKAYVELATLAESMPIGTPEYEREKKRVLEGLGVTPEAVEKQLASYNDRPELWHPLWEKIQAELQKRSAQTPASSGG